MRIALNTVDGNLPNKFGRGAEIVGTQCRARSWTIERFGRKDITRGGE
jgi:hypothetical protein